MSSAYLVNTFVMWRPCCEDLQVTVRCVILREFQMRFKVSCMLACLHASDSLTDWQRAEHAYNLLNVQICKTVRHTAGLCSAL